MSRFLFSGLFLLLAGSLLVAGATQDHDSWPNVLTAWHGLTDRLATMARPQAPAPRPKGNGAPIITATSSSVPVAPAAVNTTPAPRAGNDSQAAPDALARARAADDAARREATTLRDQVARRDQRINDLTAERDQARQQLDTLREQPAAAQPVARSADPPSAETSPPAGTRLARWHQTHKRHHAVARRDTPDTSRPVANY